MGLDGSDSKKHDDENSDNVVDLSNSSNSSDIELRPRGMASKRK